MEHTFTIIIVLLLVCYSHYVILMEHVYIDISLCNLTAYCQMFYVLVHRLLTYHINHLKWFIISCNALTYEIP